MRKKILEAHGVPHRLIIDPDGIVRWGGFRFLDGYEFTDKVVEDILAKRNKRIPPALGSVDFNRGSAQTHDLYERTR